MIFGIGIIGSGAIARVHATCIEMMLNIRFAGILSCNTTRAKILANTYNTALFTELEKYLNQQIPDWEITNMQSKYYLTTQALAKAKKSEQS